MSVASKSRLAEVVNYALQNGDEQTLQAFDLSMATLVRYKTAYQHTFNTESTTQYPHIISTAEGPNRTIVSKSSSIRTLEQLLAYCKVDLSIWNVTRHVVNMWGSPQNSNFQVKAWLSKKKIEIDEKQELQELIEEAKRYAPKYPKRLPGVKYARSDNLYEISLFDHHFGQLSWGKETRGQNYDIRIARNLALDAINYFLSRVKNINIDRILLPIGNDFFNVNDAMEVTAAGTFQSEDDRWQKTFVKGRKLWVDIIEKCMTKAPVTVLIIPGNHDRERVFYLGDALECWFEKCQQVSIENAPTQRKYYEWGKCFLGFTHGNQEPKGTLINIMATEMPSEWSRTKYREWHKGHIHAANAKAFQILDEDRGIREWVLPSLVALDDWHARKGYGALRESIAMIWHKEKGKTDMFMYHP